MGAATETEVEAARRRGELMQAVAAEHSALLAGRSLAGSELSFRAGLYFATLSSAVVALGFVSQRGQSLVEFALIILPVVFLLGIFSYGRMLQNAVHFMIGAQGVDRIRRFYREIDPAHSDLFHELHPGDTALMKLGIFNLGLQQFLAATTMVAIVNGAGGGTALATLAAALFVLPTLALAAIGVVGALGLSAAFMLHQWWTWKRVLTALPGLTASG